MTKEKLHYPDRFLNRGLSKATALVLVTLAIGLSGCQAGTASNTTPVVDSEKNYGVSPFHAHIKSMGSDSQSALADALKKATGIQCLTGSGGENSAVSVITQPNALVVRRKDGTELTRLQVPHDQTPSPKQLLAIGEILKSEYKRSFFLDLRRSNADLKLEVRCIPVVKSVEVVEGKKTVRLEDKPFDGGKTLSLQQGEPFMIEIRNLGTKRSFFNVLNIGPGSSVAQIYPSVDRPYKQENFVDPDRQWHRIPRPYVWSASPPFGTELIKVIATLEPYDFSLLMDPDAPRQDVNKLGELGKLIYSANTCNGVEQISPEVEWSTTQTSIQTRAGNVVAESGSEPSKQKLADKDEKLLSKPERITVYSIKPDAVSRDKKAGFQGYPIELATEVGDPYSRHEIAQALMKSIKEPEGRKRCWIPHHAVRV
ncbi:MAG: DUF4384 domain-containing protein, partial [Cyanobacteria bacterium]|nr:DUF4384 domain-containing protein [Cyanobacteriota bacterium]